VDGAIIDVHNAATRNFKASTSIHSLIVVDGAANDIHGSNPLNIDAATSRGRVAENLAGFDSYSSA